MSNGPSWYEILGVDPSATPEQIKAAWRSATDKFEPGSGQSQFRLFNEAADVLLDPERRREYDEDLGLKTEAPVTRLEKPAAPEPSPVPELAPAAADVVVAGDVAGEEPQRRSLLVPVLAILAVLALVLVGVFGVLIKQQSDDAGIGLLTGVTDGDAQARADAAASAGAAAERALAAALSFDYRRMPADRKRALGYMSERFGKEYAKTFDQLLTAARPGQPNNVVKTKTVLKATVLEVGVMTPTANTTDRVRVLAWVNQAKGEKGSTVFRNRVSATMVRQGSAWVIDALHAY